MQGANSQNPFDELASEISSFQSDINSLQDDIRLTHLRSEVEDVENTANSLPQRIADLRGRGYAFGKGLEGRAPDIKTRWNFQRMTVLSQITQQTSNLDIDMPGIENMMSQVQVRANDPNNARLLLAQVKAAVSALVSKVNASEDAVKAIVSSYANDKAAVDKVKTVPTQRQVFGGANTPRVLGGMDSIKCEYCGNVNPL